MLARPPIHGLRPLTFIQASSKASSFKSKFKFNFSTNGHGRETLDISKLFISPGVDREEEIKKEMLIAGSNIVKGPYAGDARVKEVQFVKSSERPKDCPRDGRPEIALLGRSNVGKSSLINCLVRKDLAMTSKRPGKTQLINHFLIDKSWYLVDLPGYGYADAPDSARSAWNEFTKGFFLNRDTIVVALLLIDASIPPQKIDIDCALWLDRIRVPLTFVFTKCDKRKSAKSGARKVEENIEDFLDMVQRVYAEMPAWVMTSSVTCLGRDELLLHLSQLRNYWDN